VAHFELDGKRISKQSLTLLKQQVLTVGLWGATNRLVNPPQELDVAANPSGAVKLERSSLPITNMIRKWKITGVQAGVTTIVAKAGNGVWDSFELDVQPAAYKFLTKDKQQFIGNMAKAGGSKAKEFGYPLSAMIACACGESGFGTSGIFKRTGCPFNLQKPADWEYPKCETEQQETENKPGEKAKPAPFCKAKDLSDAARLWCEWIAHFPRDAARRQLIDQRSNPKAFAESLFLVAFANSDKDRTKKFGELLEQYELRRFD
jgi:flagellum-specific peptidoglycan hydrolase FlgJ